MSRTVMPLKDIVYGICNVPESASAVNVGSVTSDSRQVTPGSLFVGIPGNSQNGAAFLDEAVRRGAVAALLGLDTTAVAEIPILKTSDPRRALSMAARNFFRSPGEALSIIGVTGTNGKTTSCWLLEQALSALNRRTLRLGTAGNYLKDVVDEDAVLTTLDPVQLHGYFDLARRSGATHVAMEASSHALHQQRLADVPFSVALFTNLTRDHLDYHGTFEAYETAKRGLFDLLLPDGCAVINLDDQCGLRFVDYCRGLGRRVMTFGRATEADVRLVESAFEVDSGMRCVVSYRDENFAIVSPLIGDFNCENVVGVFSALIGADFPPAEAAAALKDATGAPGRLERIVHAGRTAFIDYAHTPDALDRALRALRPITRAALRVVFGCGGDRDRGKRPIMGEIASQLSDKTYVTSDNPRSENPEAIIEEILRGAGPAAVHVADRAAAISMAVGDMQVGDVLLVAGKGHEDYQILQSGTVPFSDKLIVQAALQRSFP